MLEVGNQVEIKLVDVIGEVIELDENSVLVKHFAEIDGQNKSIEQWYDKEICTEVE